MKKAFIIIILIKCLVFFSCGENKKVRDISDYKDSIARQNSVPFLPDVKIDTIIRRDYSAKYFINIDSLLENCKSHTKDMAKSDSVIFKKGWYYTMLKDCLVVEPYEKRKGTIESVCANEMKFRYSEDEIKEIDSCLVDGSYLLIRNADRSLDTIVNHQRFIFTILP